MRILTICEVILLFYKLSFLTKLIWPMFFKFKIFLCVLDKEPIFSNKKLKQIN